MFSIYVDMSTRRYTALPRQLPKVVSKQKQQEPKPKSAALKKLEQFQVKKQAKPVQVKKPKRIINYKKLVTDFQNSEKTKISFSRLNEDKFKAILLALRPRNGYHTTLEANGDFYPVTQTNLNNLGRLAFSSTQSAQIGSDDIIYSNIIVNKRLTILQKKIPVVNQRKRGGGAFFPYLNTTVLDLSKYGIYTEVKKENYTDNCLVHALNMAGIDTKPIKYMVSKGLVPVCKLAEIADIIETTIVLLKENDQKRYFGDYEDEVNIGLIADHYFYNDRTTVNSYAIKNYETLSMKPKWQTFKSATRHETKPIMAFELIKIMLEKGLFKPIDQSTAGILATQYYDAVPDAVDLNYGKNEVRQVSIEKKLTEYTGIYYADFETTTTDQHIAYMCCVTNGIESKTFVGPYCASLLLDYLPTGSITYFHNLGYDFSFLTKYLSIESLIKTGTAVKLVRGSYKKKKLAFKDSYAFIASPLRSFTKMFNIEAKKEIMPYALYNESTVLDQTVPIELAYTFDSSEEFKQAASEYVYNGQFRHMAYAEFYCLQDCKTLQQGFDRFRQWILEAFDLDPVDFVSLPSLAYNYLYDQGCMDDLYELSGTPRIFIQKCVKGGRCMTKENKMYHVTKVLNDFDAVSLYPSAMARQGFLKGKPKVITTTNLDQLLKYDGLFVECNVTIGRNRSFPLQSEFVGDVRNYTNTFSQSLYLDKTSIEDLIKYQDATIEVLRGYYYDEGRNENIIKTIKYCFEQRLKKKAEANPIEVVYKLLMNASYGKMIQKPVTEDLKFTNNASAFNKFLSYNHNYIKSYTEICNDKYVFRVVKPINKHYNLAHVGSEILSMSKRIMNEVMCLAEDLDIDIYYQDTDSMHIIDESIGKLACEFEKTYGRQLIGKGLGQFHSDFSSKISKNPTSVESYFLGKKAYIDKLSTGEHHIRLKGISESSIATHSDPMELYKKLFEHKVVKFNLAETRPIFKKDKAFNQYTMSSFVRSVKF